MNALDDIFNEGFIMTSAVSFNWNEISGSFLSALTFLRIIYDLVYYMDKQLLSFIFKLPNPQSFN